MSMLTVREDGKTLTIADYEARIEIYKEQIGTGYIGIGRTLNEAKDAGAVPHGERESWVERVTGLTIRQAQRCMQAAREIRDGSAMARLEMSKALMLLSSGLDEETREELAEQAGSGTVKKLRAEIARIRGEQEAEKAEAAEAVKALKLQITREAGTAAEIREALKKAETERNQLAAQMRASQDAWQSRMDEEAEKAYRRGADDERIQAQRAAQEKARAEYGILESHYEEAKRQVHDLKAKLEKIDDERRQDWKDGYNSGEKNMAGELERVRTELEDTKAELEAAERREEKRSQQLNRMQEALGQREMDAARGVRTQGVSGPDLGDAVRRFLAAAGVLPQMGAVIARMDSGERELLRAHVETIAAWVDDARSALSLVAADATVE